MAKFPHPVLLLLAAALCFLLSTLVPCEGFVAQGMVYCDVCRAGFVTRGTEFIPGAKVKLECKDRAGGKITFTANGVSDKQGIYEIPVYGDHEQDVCEVVLKESTRPDCKEIDPGRKGPVLDIRHKDTRLVNSLGFLQAEPVPDFCPAVMATMGLADLPPSKYMKN
ncbi:Pollen Ole e 1 allergen/extensin [Macleaya cordata]|uniref:Pollen Ole e 1 allergen/extensin n=1 Tax=Macleaya cordata TaxID=56857 RepID=A0A200Q0X3_MACCD|nr:Pollen Ole e 1 allergen/extensin [Macleaya cordata]